METNKQGTRLRLAAMQSIARGGGEIGLRYFRSSNLNCQVKGIQDFVSEADFAVENFIRGEILNLFSGDAILGEEGESTPGTSGYTWVIDPIDGTTLFVSGLSGWVVTTALVYQGKIVAGVIFDPCTNEMYSAAKSGGSRLNGSELPRLNIQDLSAGLVGTGFPSNADPQEHGHFITHLLQNKGNYYRDGSAASMLAKVASGRLLALYQPHLKAWDCLAGLLLIEEAGGKTFDIDMETMLKNGGPVLGAAPGVFEQLQDLI